MKLVTLLEEVKATTYLQEAVKIHGSPSSLEAPLTELKNDLKDAEERYKVTPDSTKCRISKNTIPRDGRGKNDLNRVANKPYLFQ